MDTIAVVLQQPEQIELHRLALTAPTADDVVVDVEWSGVSTGTERLLWSGRMPPFPGMGYPLVPGYESVGRVVEAGSTTELRPGQHVFEAVSSFRGDALAGAPGRSEILLHLRPGFHYVVDGLGHPPLVGPVEGQTEGHQPVRPSRDRGQVLGQALDPQNVPDCLFRGGAAALRKHAGVRSRPTACPNR